ncbi:hypothetical protein AAKU67_003151 [Oxalobacteraceae bacterium GrIS 2.11]
MLDVHPPHHPTHTWKDFFIHLATIVVGLLIAVGLEQTVESLHHRHLANEFEDQMREEFISDRTMLKRDLVLQSAYRAYLADLQTAINAKLQDQPFTMPSRDDPRNLWDFNIPQFSAYYVAKQNGTLSYINNKKLGVFNRIARQHDVLIDIFTTYRAGEDAIQAFRLQYDPQAEPIIEYSSPPRYADVGSLSKPELLRYRVIIANMMVQVDTMMWRFKLMNRLIQLTQEGITDEVELSKQVGEKFTTDEPK